MGRERGCGEREGDAAGARVDSDKMKMTSSMTVRKRRTERFDVDVPVVFVPFH